MEEYQLPKCWLGRIKKYWNKTVPTDYPKSSSKFSVRFESDDVTSEVEKMESEIGTEESIVSTFVPEGNTLTGYVGTYDVVGTDGENTLLSPISVDTDKVIALHYNTTSKAWEKVEDAEVKDGYVWGTVASFSPIAVFTYKKEIHLESNISFLSGAVVVCEGNTVQIKMNDNNKIVVINPSTGKEIELTAKTAVVGGSVDGTPIASTSISIIDVPSVGNLNGVYAGSAFYDETTNSAVVGSANVLITNSTIKCVTGSYGAVRTDEVNIIAKDSTITNFVACGQSYINGINKDANGTYDTTLACRAWVKKSNIILNNIARCWIVYAGGNSGYLHVEDANLTIDGLDSCDYLTIGGSNGKTVKGTGIIKNCTSKQLQFTNRGIVGYSSAVVTDSNINLISIGGDNSEGDVDGLIGAVRLEINSGESTGRLALGVNGTSTITADAVDVVKVSRNAGNIVVDDAVKTVLGSKFVTK